MAKKVCIIKQPAGLGDLMYCHKIAAVHKNRGYKIIWPVAPSIMQANGKIDGIEFYDVTKDFPHKQEYTDGGIHPYEKRNIKYIPTYLSTKAVKSRLIMRSKYMIAKMDGHDWQNYLTLNRDMKKEEELFTTLGLKLGDKYVFINRNYKPWQGSAKVFRKKGYWPADKDMVGQFKVDSKAKKIEMRRVEGFSVFDWALVIERCTEIWTMDTCTTLMMEVLDTSNIKKMMMFCRHKRIKQISYMYRKKWVIKHLAGSHR